MKALTFLGIEKISFETLPDPGLVEPTDALVKVEQCAICGSDLHPYFGRERGIDLHTVMGHEFVGEVVEVGSSVQSIKKGDRVMSPFTTSCGACYYCTIGLSCRCIHGQLFGWRENGVGLHGGQAEFVRVPLADDTLVKIPEGVSNEEGLLLGDVMSTGFYCARQAGVKPGGTYAVIGCGPVGLMTVCGALELGAEKIFALDVVNDRLTIAQRLGADAINAGKNNALEIIGNHTHGRGVDAVMEAVGNQSAGKLAYELVRPGGIISVVGVCSEDRFAFSPEQAYSKNLTYKVGRCPVRSMIQSLIPIVHEKKYPITSIITHRMKLSDGGKGYDLFANKKENCLKVIMTP